jgi:hypothetical protein
MGAPESWLTVQLIDHSEKDELGLRRKGPRSIAVPMTIAESMVEYGKDEIIKVLRDALTQAERV